MPHPPVLSSNSPTSARIYVGRRDRALKRLIFAIAASSAWYAQAAELTFPTREYDQAVRVMQEGDSHRAIVDLTSAQRRAAGTTDAPWLDLVCLRVMMGECLYNQGNLPEALRQFDAALEVAAARQGWFATLQLPAAIAARPYRDPGFPWGTSQRDTLAGDFSSVIRASWLTSTATPSSGTDNNASRILPIRADEVVRCICLALRRRHDILGPNSGKDNFSRGIVAVLQGETCPPDHWSVAWHHAMVGIAYAAMGQSDPALETLADATAISNRIDHPATANVLIQLAEIHVAAQRYEQAANDYWEATLAAARYQQAIELEDAFRGVLQMSFLLERPIDTATLLTAAKWARAQRMQRLQADLLLSAVECEIHNDNAATAEPLLLQVAKILLDSKMSDTDIGARYQFLIASLGYRLSNPQSEIPLRLALDFFQSADESLYQIRLANQAYVDQIETPQEAVQRLKNVLPLPSDADWVRDPIAAMVRVSSDLQEPLEHWFQASWEAGQFEDAFEVAELIRANRFHSQLTLGDRLLALRCLLAAPPSTLDENQAKTRQRWIRHFPSWTDHAERMAQAAFHWSQPPTSDRVKMHRTWLLQGQSLLHDHEVRIRAMALSRIPSHCVFPPQRTVTEIRQRLRPKQAMLSFLTTRDGMYGMLLAPEAKHDVFWKIKDPIELRRLIVQLLREIGLNESGKRITISKLQSQEWRGIATQLREQLISSAAYEQLLQFEELVVVPDRALWYVPFDTLSFHDNRQPTSNSFRSKWRWSVLPTAGLIRSLDATPQAPDTWQPQNTTILVSKSAATRETQWNWIGQPFHDQIPRELILTRPLKPVDVWHLRTARSFWAAEDLTPGSGAQELWIPDVFAGTTGSSGPGTSGLDRWLAYPRMAPRQIVLSNFHTAAERPLPETANGDEIFQTICGLMATGTDTILLSQWSTGGQTSADLAREFLQELPHRSAYDAWQRSLQLAQSHTLDLEQEPSIETTDPSPPLTTEHPYWSSGYLLIDNAAPLPPPPPK